MTMFTEIYKKNWTQQHPKFLRWTSNGQFENKRKWFLEKVSKITSTFLTNKEALEMTGMPTLYERRETLCEKLIQSICENNNHQLPNLYHPWITMNLTLGLSLNNFTDF